MKIGVALLNMGGPDSLEAVQPFLENLFSDRYIFQFWFGQRAFGKMMARLRRKKSTEFYRAMGGFSPQGPCTESQRIALQAALGADFRVYTAFRYWRPLAQEAVDRAVAAGCTRLVGLSLYPHWCRASVKTSLLDLTARVGKRLPLSFIEHYPEDTAYLDALARTAQEALAASPPDAQLLFSAHGVPQRLIEKGDPYLREIEATMAGVVRRLGGCDHLLSFQSRAGPMKWLAPTTEATLRRLAAEGKRSVAIVPISFVSDHSETTYEIDILFRKIATEAGITSFVRAPALNDRPDFIAALKALVERHVRETG